MSDEEDRALGDGKTCFVISPIGNRHAPMGTDAKVNYENAIQIWEKVLQPATLQFGLTAVRADKMAEPGEIPAQIFELLRDAEVVIADVTKGNPNVMYELGMRHTRDLLTLQIGEYERLPFDVNVIRTIQFTRTEAGQIDLRNELVAQLRAGLEGRATQLTPTRIFMAATPAGPDPDALALAVAASAQPDDDSEVEEPGFIDLLAEGEAALVSINRILDETTENIEVIGAEVNDSATALQRSDNEGRGFAGRLRVAKELAEKWNGPADLLEAQADEYGREVDSLIAMIEYIVTKIEDGEESVEETRVFLESMADLAENAGEANVNIAEMATQARDTRKISRVLNDVGTRINRALNRFIASSAKIEAFGPRIRDLLEVEGEADGEAVSHLT